MVPMGVGENEVEFPTIFSNQLIAEAPHTGAGVDDDNIIAFCANFDAGGISAVFEIRFTGDWNRSSGPPALNNHRLTLPSALFQGHSFTLIQDDGNLGVNSQRETYGFLPMMVCHIPSPSHCFKMCAPASTSNVVAETAWLRIKPDSTNHFF